jgi:hypothetical protein
MHAANAKKGSYSWHDRTATLRNTAKGHALILKLTLLPVPLSLFFFRKGMELNCSHPLPLFDQFGR